MVHRMILCETDNQQLSARETATGGTIFFKPERLGGIFDRNFFVWRDGVLLATGGEVINRFTSLGYRHVRVY